MTKHTDWSTLGMQDVCVIKTGAFGTVLLLDGMGPKCWRPCAPLHMLSCRH